MCHTHILVKLINDLSLLVLVSVVGLLVLILMCITAFVWGAHSAKRQKDLSYALYIHDARIHNNRRYQTFI